MPLAKNSAQGAYHQHLVVRIHLLVGEPERALDLLEPLLEMPYYLTPAWLRVDPNFAMLKGHPRFERLLDTNSPAGKSISLLGRDDALAVARPRRSPPHAPATAPCAGRFGDHQAGRRRGLHARLPGRFAAHGGGD